MKIYTRSGDKGQTSLIGGKRVSKNNPRVNAYGTLDELNALIGMTLAVATTIELEKDLRQIQHTIFDCGIDLASPDDLAKSLVKEGHITWLEERIDFYNSQVPQLKSFILPGGCLAASHLHLARTVARRAEREIVALMETETINSNVVSYVNRLSDYLFVAARLVNFEDGDEEHIYKTQK